MQVVHFNRKPRKFGNYSIEAFYGQIREALKDKIEFKVVECPYESNGIFKRLFNAIYAAFKQGEINHVTGDVNYLNMFFRKNRNIITVLDCGLLYDTKGLAHQLYKFFWFTLPIKRAKYVVAISQATKDEILKFVKCDPDKIIPIYVAVSIKFKRVDKTFNKEKPVILFIGSAPNKNLKRLIMALEGISCKLDIVANLRPDELALLKEKKIDYRVSSGLTEDEVIQKYNECDILTLVSTYEGFGMPIVEANIVGRPVITSNCYSMPEVAGNAALIVDPYNINEIRNGILKIIDDDEYRNKLIKLGIENANRFWIKNISGKYFEIYQSIIKQ